MKPKTISLHSEGDKLSFSISKHHIHLLSHLKKDQKEIRLMCSPTLSPPRGKRSKTMLTKVMLHTQSRTDSDLSTNPPTEHVSPSLLSGAAPFGF